MLLGVGIRDYNRPISTKEKLKLWVYSLIYHERNCSVCTNRSYITLDFTLMVTDSNMQKYSSNIEIIRPFDSIWSSVEWSWDGFFSLSLYEHCVETISIVFHGCILWCLCINVGIFLEPFLHQKGYYVESPVISESNHDLKLNEDSKN